jgi:hypothetical protein
MEQYIKDNVGDITYESELTLDILRQINRKKQNVKG